MTESAKKITNLHPQIYCLKNRGDGLVKLKQTFNLMSSCKTLLPSHPPGLKKHETGC